MAETTGKLRTRTKVFYGIGDIGNALINSAIQFSLMKFYTDGALILPALAGNALLIGKMWDAINDPLFGWHHRPDQVAVRQTPGVHDLWRHSSGDLIRPAVVYPVG